MRRLGFLVLVVWAASTITFFVPRISSRNPVRERFALLARGGGFSPENQEQIVQAYSTKFGLDKPLSEQYWDYISSLARFDLGVSINQFPKSVLELIMEALPWTIGLLLVSTILSFIIGNLLGGLAAWPGSPAWVRNLSTSFVLLLGVPPVLMGVLLIFFLGFQFSFVPISGSYTAGTFPAFSASFVLDVGRHMILPALSLILGTVGGWVLGMRGMGVTIQGEDYVLFAEHKGLSSSTIFRNYYLRNAMLPQVTGFALALGNVVTSAIIVEQIFGLPGLGTLLGDAIRANDFLVIYGIVLFITFAIALLMVLVELFYPLLDPRIRSEK